jgi:hypothetical protein
VLGCGSDGLEVEIIGVGGIDDPSGGAHGSLPAGVLNEVLQNRERLSPEAQLLAVLPQAFVGEVEAER